VDFLDYSNFGTGFVIFQKLNIFTSGIKIMNFLDFL